MNSKTHTIYVCTNVDCRNRGAQAVLEALRTRLNDGDTVQYQVEEYLCFSACNSGPNVVVPDRRCWLSGVKPDDVQAIAAYLAGGEPVQHLMGGNDPDLEQMIFDIIDAGLLPDH